MFRHYHVDAHRSSWLRQKLQLAMISDTMRALKLLLANEWEYLFTMCLGVSSKAYYIICGDCQERRIFSGGGMGTRGTRTRWLKLVTASCQKWSALAFVAAAKSFSVVRWKMFFLSSCLTLIDFDSFILSLTNTRLAVCYPTTNAFLLRLVQERVSPTRKQQSIFIHNS